MTSADTPRYRLTFGDHIPEDLAALEATDPALTDAAEGALDDLAHGRVTGKELGQRHITGDLRGLARVKFDLPDRQPQRFRLLYQQLGDGTRHVFAIGARDEHAIYRTATSRLEGRTT